MRELHCVVVPDSRGWWLMVGPNCRGWFPSKNRALRAAIVEAQRVRAAGFYSSVRLRHETNAIRESVETDRVGCTRSIPTTAEDLSNQVARPLGSMQAT
jgi:hypothetical protein